MVRALVLVLVAGCKFSGPALTDGGAPVADAALDASTDGPWRSIALGDEHACALQSDASLWCWGNNQYGQLGVGALPYQAVAPTRVGTDTWKHVSTGARHTCAIKTDDTLWCWGDNANGQLGVVVTSPSYAPVMVPGAWKHVAAGNVHTCAISGDDLRFCWGNNALGELGDGTTTAQPAPLQIGTATWKAVDAGNYVTCGIQSDDSLWCNGANNVGQIGDLTLTQRSAPVPIGVTTTWKAIHVPRYGHTCGIQLDGHLACWGYNVLGQLGDTTTTTQVMPVPVATDADWTDVSVGTYSTCGTHADGRLACWGDDAFGQGGIGGAIVNPSPVTVVDLSLGGDGVIGVSLVQHTSCALTAHHHLACTGVAAYGQLADGNGLHATPQQITGSWTRVSAGQSFTCADRMDGTTLCWGIDSSGQLGVGDVSPRQVPVQIAGPVGPASTASAIAAGSNSTCEIRSDMSVWCWGTNGAKELGQASPGSSSSPIALPGIMAKAIDVSDHACAISSTGALSCWGPNKLGQLGAGPAIDSALPAVVAGGGTYNAVATGYRFTCGIKAPDHLMCWGDDAYGQVGDGMTTTTGRLAPVDLGGGPFQSVAAGDYHACAIDATGSLFCWGFNGNGELGNNTTIEANAPVKIGTDKWRSVALGTRAGCAIRLDNTLWCWGANATGQLGTGAFVERHVPTQVGTESTWASATMGNGHACATKLDHSLWCWGLGDRGQLGDGAGWRAAWVAF